MRVALLATMALTAWAFTSETHYEQVNSVHFHNVLRLARMDELDGVVMALVDQTVDGASELASEYNEAAAIFKCLFKGGVKLMSLGSWEDDPRGQFILSNFHNDYRLGIKERFQSPFVAYFENEKPVSWHKGNWSKVELISWAFAAANLTYIEDASALAAFETRVAAHPMFVFGIFSDSLCEEDAKTLYEAIAKHRASGSDLPVAVTANVALADELEPGRGDSSGIYAAFPGSRRMKYPAEASLTATCARPLAQCPHWHA